MRYDASRHRNAAIVSLFMLFTGCGGAVGVTVDAGEPDVLRLDVAVPDTSDDAADASQPDGGPDATEAGRRAWCCRVDGQELACGTGWTCGTSPPAAPDCSKDPPCVVGVPCETTSVDGVLVPCSE